MFVYVYFTVSQQKACYYCEIFIRVGHLKLTELKRKIQFQGKVI